MDLGPDRLRALLAASLLVKEAGWPSLHPRMKTSATGWVTASMVALETEFAEFLEAVSDPKSRVRYFWKAMPALSFGGCNPQFAQDAGLPREALIGLTDLDPRLPWARQAAKYRQDDQEIIESGKPDLELVERQATPSGGISWVRVAKAPLRTASEEIFGLVGMYESLDGVQGPRLYGEYMKHRHQQG
jgi:PAS domain-containing protein